MSKRGGIKKSMELKKLFIILMLISFTTNLHAKIIKPAKNLTPYDIVKIQLDALQKNNQTQGDLGIKQVWLFAHPENKKVTGPYERFKSMIYGKQYKILLNHSSHKINLIMNTNEKYIYGVELLDKNKQLFFYEWHVQKATEENCIDCWFTTAVSIPIDQGNSI